MTSARALRIRDWAGLPTAFREADYWDHTDTDAYAAAFPQLGRRRRYAEEPRDPPVDCKLVEWAKAEKSIISKHAASSTLG